MKYVVADKRGNAYTRLFDTPVDALNSAVTKHNKTLRQFSTIGGRRADEWNKMKRLGYQLIDAKDLKP